MGLLNLLKSGKHAKEITCALIGSYVYFNLKDDYQREKIILHIFRKIVEYSPFRMSVDEAEDKFTNSPSIVQSAFIANAMIDLGIQHGVRRFQWDYIPNPFALITYSHKARNVAFSNILGYGINPKECFGNGEL